MRSCVITAVCAGSRLKTAIMIMLGLALGTVGLDKLTGVPRITLGSTELTGGLSFTALAIGLFGLSEILINLEKTDSIKAIRPEAQGAGAALEGFARIARRRSGARRSSDSFSESFRA